MHKQRLFILVAAGIGVLSAFLSWISITIFGVSITASGISSDAGSGGWITLVLCGAAAGIAFTQGDKSAELDAKLKKSVAGLGAAVVLYMLFFIFVKAEARFGMLGMGVWFTFLAGLGVLALPFVVKGDGNFEMPTKDTIKADLDGDEAADSKGDDVTS